VKARQLQSTRSGRLLHARLGPDYLFRDRGRQPDCGRILADGKRLSDFNTSLPTKFPKKASTKVSRIEDFEELKEADVIEVCRTANLISKNIIEILSEKLKRRNLAAHPSQVVVAQHQANEAISDLVNNVILALA
jgi:hypothetical protein